MPGKRIPDLTAITGADTASDDNLVIFDTSANTTKRILPSELPFVPAGTGAVTRTTQAKLRESVSVKDFGAVGDGVTDDTAAIQAAINANPGRIILFSRGTYSVNEIIVSSDNTTIDLDGSSLTVRSNNINCITFKPTTAGTTAAFLNGCSIKNGNILMVGFPNSTGAGIELRQCNGFTMENIVFYDADLQIYGGQLSRAIGCRHYASSGSKGTGSAMIHLREAPYGSGLYQPCYTFEFADWVVGCGVLRDACIRIHSGDGITFHGGYAARGANTQVLIMSSRNGSYVGPLRFNGSYLDALSPTTGSPHSVEIRADGNSSSIVYSLFLDGCTLGNGTSVGLVCDKPETYVISAVGCYIVNFASWGVSIEEAGTTGDVLISGCQLQNNGDGVSGVVRLAGTGGESFNITGNIFTNSQNLCVSMDGTWGRGAIVGNVNNSAIADIATTTAVFSNPLVISGNASAYAFPGTAFSWVGEKMVLANLADNAAAVSAGLRTGQLYQTSGAVKVVT